MEIEKIIKDLKNKIYHPVYFLQGEEPYYIDLIVDYISEQVLDESEKEFNQSILYGKDVDEQIILSYAKRFPMMSNYQVVIVKEAQDIKKIEDSESLEYYFQKPLNTTILVFAYKYKKLDMRTKFSKAVAKNGIVFESKKLYDNQLPAWVSSYLHHKNYSISPKGAALIAENIGNYLSRISNELDKLCINKKEGSEITTDDIEKYIGISKEYNVFELQNALGKKDIVKANKIANHYAANPKNNPIVVVFTNLYSFFSKLMIYHQLQDKTKGSVAASLGVNPFFVKDYEQAARLFPMNKLRQIISDLREYDVKSKGVGATTDHGELLKELVFKVLHK